MVTSTLITPSAIDVNLPQSGEEAPLKPITEVYIDAQENLFLVANRNDSTPEATQARQVTRDELLASLLLMRSDSVGAPPIALYADSTVRYARVVEVLDLAARNNLHLVLATRPKAN